MNISKPFQLSPRQQEILVAQGNIVVVAGAGTGKTETLTQRVLHLLEQAATPETAALALHEFVALTFTDKAAGEMRQRIYQSLLRKLVATSDETERIRWRELCAGFAEANRIGTFDAFNNRLLAAYPEYQVAPAQFAPTTDYDEREIATRIMRAFWHWVENLEADDAAREDTFLLLEFFSRRKLSQFLGALAKEPADHLARLAAPMSESQFRQHLQNIANFAARGVERRAHRKIATLWNRWSEFLRREFLLPPELQSVLQNEAELSAQFFEIFTGTTTFRKKWIPADYKDLCAEIEARALPILKDWQSERKSLEANLASLFNIDQNFDLDFRAHRVLSAAARLAQWWSTQREELCRREGWLSFEDAHRAALNLLENHPEVAQRMRTGSRFLMVDEFQDTNFAQWRLLNAIRDENNLMLIGDGKQSIYGFRGGDITVFDEVRNAHLPQHSVHSLSVSQRATPNLTQFFNALFQNILPPENSEREAFEAPFQELESAREAQKHSGVYVLQASENLSIEPQLETSTDSAATSSHEPTEINDLFYDENESVWPLVERARSEAETLAETTALFLREIQDDADAINSHLDGYEFLQPRFESISRKIAGDVPGAIGVLFRSHDRKATFENALKNAGVRYASVKGIGFFQSQPVYDAINILRFLFDAHDSLALAGVLRSSLVGASDLALMELRRVQVEVNGGSLWAALETRCSISKIGMPDAEYSLSSADEAALRLALSRLRSWREMTRVQLVSAVLEAIWNETEIAFSESLPDNGFQQQQNWRKIFDIIRAREEQGRGSARALAEYFASQAKEEEKEADAELPEGGSIQLMTIYAAKGLGFDMTIVGQMDSVVRADSRFWGKGALQNRDDIFYALNLADDESEDEKPLLWKILSEEKRARDEAEFARLFYVACTRARDFLMLAMPDEPRKSSWAQMAQPLLNNKAIIALQALKQRQESRASVNFSASAGELALQNFAPEPRVETRLLAPLAKELGRETSVTQWLEFQRNSSENISDETGPPSTPRADSMQQMRAALHDPRAHGEVFHRLLRIALEQISRNETSAGLKKSLDDFFIQRFCRAGNLPIERAPILRLQLNGALSWLRSQGFDLNSARSELAFSVPMGIAAPEYSGAQSQTQWMNGVIDLLAVGENGPAIIDFKTHAGNEALEELLKQRGYDQQIAAYRRAAEYSGLEIGEALVVFIDETGNAEAFPV